MKKSYADMDPLEEIRAIREEINREFPTAKALGEYLRQKYPAKSPAKSSARKTGAVKPAKSAKRPALRKRRQLANA